MKNIILFLAAIGFSLSALSQDLPAYELYTKDGKAIKYGKMMKEIADADVVLFGENHNNAMIHWMELQVTKSM